MGKNGPGKAVRLGKIYTALTKSRMNENGSSFWGEQSKIYLMIYLSK